MTQRPLQNGAASLVVLLLLLGASLLVAAWSQRHVITELRIAANQVRRVVAFEAAEAGLAWTQAMLNTGTALGADCQASSAPGSSGFLARYLGPPDAAGRMLPRRRSAGSSTLPLQLACARRGGAWVCHCPTAAAPTPVVDDGAAAPAFLVEFVATTSSGVVEVVATGCSHLARPCAPAASERADASVRLRVSLALLPTLATPPAASLTALGNIDAGAAALGLHNADARAGGLVAHAGGSVLGTALRLQTVPGGAVTAAVLGGDEALARLDAAQLFVRHFGVEPGQWPLLPGVRSLRCNGDCSAALVAAVDAQVEPARLAVQGDVELAGALQLGSPSRPVVLVIDGALRLSGPVKIHGLVHADSLQWDNVAPDAGGLLHGAAVLSGHYGGDGAPDIVYDPNLVHRLQHQAGTWVRVPGSWRDF